MKNTKLERRLILGSAAWSLLLTLALWAYAPRPYYLAQAGGASVVTSLFLMLGFQFLAYRLWFRGPVARLLRGGHPIWAGLAAAFGTGYFLEASFVAAAIQPEALDRPWASVLAPLVFPLFPWVVFPYLLVPYTIVVGYLQGAVFYEVMRKQKGWRTLAEEDPWNE